MNGTCPPSGTATMHIEEADLVGQDDNQYPWVQVAMNYAASHLNG